MVGVCMSVEQDDVVTIITDNEHADQAARWSQIVRRARRLAGRLNNETRCTRGRADMNFPMAPPVNLHQAMVASDEIIIITNLEWANRFAHVSAVKESCAANAQDRFGRGGHGHAGT